MPLPDDIAGIHPKLTGARPQRLGSTRRFARPLAGLLFVAALTAGSPAQAAIRLDLLDFLTRDPGAESTYRGTLYLDGRSHPAEMKFKTLGVDEFGDVVSLRTSLSMFAGPLRYIETTEEEVDRQGFRQIRSDVQRNGQRFTRSLDSWTAIRPRFVHIGQKYPLNERHRFGGGLETLSGTELFLVESVPTELGTFECVRVTTEYERTHDDKRIAPVRGLVETWFARNVGVVRLRFSHLEGSSGADYDVILVACSRPPVFQPVVRARP